jgi:hypothetical protein
MYYMIILCLMLIFPLVSIIFEIDLNHSASILSLIGKWFTFWAVGVRLFTAGLRQAIQPKYTAENILNIKTKDALIMIRELGFANLAIGTLGILSIFVSNGSIAGAITGGVFYMLAGTNHAFQHHRNRLENVAMVSDIFIASVLLTYCLSRLLIS